ncbi:hypothetical protein C0Q70_08957 [Pomacea canaliculata]|uniref:Uncharacterized protein n=1 Tax=Pomacea canaliculata TaxID=400727 RepID=A0A2T7P8G3_POMCA|nr:uncharacterized protein LOC112564008 [Pomacea canaliculata]XP_025094304.1 uncharacterized protein LOC112564008 [Pomacea canaliculata]XP_025094306.1 uncharacterized protein LOC112564008 [Pomacea canaliculata]XP_025094307.1 uncharacterized protein LOC112564008 [Pomacea canaliculata]PVD29701.1 hypothetical protein C0Q70_08957 [Pomacea canaliculata]
MGSDSRWRCVLVLWTLLGSTEAGWISGVCNNETASPNQPPHPDLPAQFEAFVQCNMVDLNLTYLVHEYFDYPSNMGRLTQMGNGAKGDLYYDYGNNELLNFDRINGGCMVTNITSDDNRFLFGVKTKGSENHIFSAAGALHFEQGTERYLGTDVVRGIRVEKWHSCQYMPVLDATVNVTWYFSDKSAWDTAIGKRSVPVRAVVVGKINDGNNVRSFNHIYDFFHFRDAINPMDLQLQSGDYCQNRVKQVPFPKLPKVFSITGEKITFSDESVKTVEEHYDQDNKLNVYRYQSPDNAGTLQGVLDVTEINDFNSGIAYIINTATGVCQMKNITDGSFKFSYVSGSSGSVRQQTPTEFFLLNGTISYSYGGVKTHRGINCDTWIGGSVNPDNGHIIRQEWCFATTDYQNWELPSLGLDTSYQIPILFTQWEEQDDSQPTSQFNGFSFDLDRPLISKLDVSACFHGAQRINVRFNVDGGYKSAVTYNIENFKAALRSAVSLFLGVSQLQIADIEVYTGGQNITVTFDLLDTPPTAQDINSPTVFNSLNNALSLLTSPSTANNFEISVVNGVTVTSMRPLNNTGRLFFSNGTCLGCDLLNAPITGSAISSSQSSGYSGGALGGLAFAMVVVGGAFGTVGGYFLFGRRGPQSGIVTFQEMMKQ